MSLQQYAVDNELHPYVSFETFESNIESVIKEADVVLNFSESESFSMTCAEASFYGLPVIVTKCGGPQEIIVHEQTGLWVNNRDIGQMTDAMLFLAARPDLRQVYGQNARSYVRNKFSSKKYLNTIAPVLESLL